MNHATVETNPSELCSFPGCGRYKRARGLCSGHWSQLDSGKGLHPISPGPARGSAARSERFAELLRQTARESHSGGSIPEQAARMGVTVKRYHDLRKHARRRGLDVFYERAEREARILAEVSSAGRCRCGLLLPCHSCLPDLRDELANSRRNAE